MTAITVHSLEGSEAETVAEWEDGEWVSGAEEMEAIFGEEAPEDAEEVLRSLDHPRLFAEVPEDYEPDEGKAWAPYTGPRGGEGWENTATHEVRYTEEPPGEPETDDPDPQPDPQTVEETGIYGANTYKRVSDSGSLEEGYSVEWYDPEQDYVYGDMWVSEVGEDSVTLEDDSGLEVTVPAPGGEPEGVMRRRQSTFYGDGVARAEGSWLPDEKEPDEVQLVAEALRTAAETESPAETGPMESFAERALELGAPREKVETALAYAMAEHPAHSADEAGALLERADQKGLDDADHRPLEEVLADEDLPTTNTLALAGKAWVPYQGPQGGEGWMEPATGEVRYQKEPPGETADPGDLDDDQLGAIAEYAGVTVPEVREALGRGTPDPLPGVDEGDTIEVTDPRGEQYEATFGGVTDSGKVVATLVSDDPYADGMEVVVEPEDVVSENDNIDSPEEVRRRIERKFDSYVGTKYASPEGVSAAERLLDSFEESLGTDYKIIIEEVGTGVYYFDSSRLFLPEDLLGDYPARTAAEGRTSSDHPAAVWIHEIGHAAHHHSLQRIPDAADKAELIRDNKEGIEETVSSYATTSPMEYVAEVFTGAASGIEYPDWVWDIYEEFEGPPVPDEPIPREGWAEVAEGKLEEGEWPGDEHEAVWESYQEWLEETGSQKARVYVDNVHEAPDGAVVHSDEDDGLYYVEEDEGTEKLWVPYQGPEGGEGWEDTETGEVRYQQEAPGETVSVDDLREAMGDEQAREFLDEMPDELFNALERGHYGEEGQLTGGVDYEDIERGQRVTVRRGSEVKTGVVDRSGTGGQGPYVEVLWDDGGRDFVYADDPEWQGVVTGVEDVDYEIPDEPATSEDLGVDLNDARQARPDTTKLSTRQTDAVWDGLEERHGRLAVSDARNFIQQWKHSSYQDAAQTLERAYMEANDIGGEPRNHQLQGEEPDDRVVGVLRDIGALSREFMKEHYGDEVRVYRGIGNRAHEELMANGFAALAEEAVPQSLELTMSPVSNFSTDEAIGGRFGSSTTKVGMWRDTDDVVNATDLVTRGKEGPGEAEVSFKGGKLNVSVQSAEVRNQYRLSNLYSTRMNPQHAEAFLKEAHGLLPSELLLTSDRPTQILNNPDEDEEWERRMEEEPDADPSEVAREVVADMRDLSPPPDETLDGMEVFAERVLDTIDPDGGWDAGRAVEGAENLLKRVEMLKKSGDDGGWESRLARIEYNKAETKQEDDGPVIHLDLSKDPEDLDWLNRLDPDEDTKSVVTGIDPPGR